MVTLSGNSQGMVGPDLPGKISPIMMQDDRLQALQAFHEEDPDDAFVRFALAQEYLKCGDIEQALRFFEGLVSDDPEYVGTWYHLGKLYQELGRREDAIRTYKQGVAIAGRQRDTHAQAELRDALMQIEGVGFDD